MHSYWRLLAYLRPHRRVIAFTWLISIAVLGMQGLTIWIGADFIERILRGREAAGLVLNHVGEVAGGLSRLANQLLMRSTPFRSMAAAVGILVGTGLVTMSLRVWKMAIFARINQTILHQVRVQMFEHMIRLDLGFSRQRRPGEIASLFTRDVDTLRGAIIDICDRIFMQPLRLLMAIFMLWSLSPSMALVLAASLVVCGAATHVAGTRVHHLSRKLTERFACLQGFLTEYLTTVLLARSLGRERVEKTRFDSLCRELAEVDIKLTVANSLAPQLINNLFVAAGAIILLFGSYQVLVSHRMDASVMLRFVLCLPLASYPVEALAMLYVSSRQSTASAARVFAFLDEPTGAADSPGAIEPPNLLTTVRFEEVCFRPADRRVLDGVNFAFKVGERVLVSGASGAGKTTLLNMLSGVTRPHSGRILINGMDLNGFRGEPWRQRIGVVPQESLMMNGTVRENLRFANENATDGQMVAVLEAVLFEPDRQNCELALDRPVGNRGELLSGGERQRLAIGRALLRTPLVLLLDEPIAQLDPANRARIKRTLQSLPRSLTMVFTSHDGTLHDLADLEIELEHGTCQLRQRA